MSIQDEPEGQESNEDSLFQLLKEFDESDTPIDEHEISSRISAFVADDDGDVARFEALAFGFYEKQDNTESGWGTYFGPMMVWTADDGKVYERPSLDAVDESALNYWEQRSRQTANPLMRARYAGLIWDFSERITGVRPDHLIALAYVDALLEVCDRDFTEHPTETINKVSRAYQMARALNNQSLIERSISSAIDLESRIAEDSKAGLWGFCFQLFILGKENLLQDSQRSSLITDLENRLIRLVSAKDPWPTESAALSLAIYYRTQNDAEAVKRVIGLVGQCFEDACEDQAPLLASSWYQHVHSIYMQFGLHDKANDVSKKIASVGPQVVESMQSVSHSMEIPTEELENYLSAIIDGGLESALHRITIRFIPKRGEIEQQVQDLSKAHPLSYMFTKTLQDHQGRPVATIGTVENDLEGNVVHQLNQNMAIDSFFLRHCLRRFTEVYTPSTEEIVSFLAASPIFEESKMVLISKGIEAIFLEDYISGIHILTPQIEAAVRHLVELSGSATLRQNRQGGLQLRTLDDLLRDTSIVTCFGEDAAFYFRSLLTDQRGWNIRNDVCHSLVTSAAFNNVVSDRLFHMMLVLAQVREREPQVLSDPA